jgi:hypothetical protein
MDGACSCCILETLLARLGGNLRTTRFYGEEGLSVREGQEGWGLFMGVPGSGASMSHGQNFAAPIDRSQK